MNSLAADAHAFFNISRGDIFSKTDNIFALMLEGNYILCFRSARVHNLGQATDLERRILLHHLLISFDVPLRWHGKTSVGLFDTLKVNNFLVKVFDFSLNFFERLSVGPLAVPLEQIDVTFRERDTLVILHHLIKIFLVVIRLLFCRIDLLFRFLFLL